MKLKNTISWLMGRVQKSLFPHLNQCLPAPLTGQEQQLVTVLEIAQIERYVPKYIANYRYPGRKPGLIGRLWPERLWRRHTIVSRQQSTCAGRCCLPSIYGGSVVL